MSNDSWYDRYNEIFSNYWKNAVTASSNVRLYGEKGKITFSPVNSYKNRVADSGSSQVTPWFD